MAGSPPQETRPVYKTNLTNRHELEFNVHSKGITQLRFLSKIKYFTFNLKVFRFRVKPGMTRKVKPGMTRKRCPVKPGMTLQNEALSCHSGLDPESHASTSAFEKSTFVSPGRVRNSLIVRCEFFQGFACYPLSAEKWNNGMGSSVILHRPAPAAGCTLEQTIPKTFMKKIVVFVMMLLSVAAYAQRRTVRRSASRSWSRAPRTAP